jgi:hypothetical protein
MDLPPPRILFFREGLSFPPGAMVVLEAGGVVSSEGWVDGVTLVGREGEGVLRLDFMGCV